MLKKYLKKSIIFATIAMIMTSIFMINSFATFYHETKLYNKTGGITELNPDYIHWFQASWSGPAGRHYVYVTSNIPFRVEILNTTNQIEMMYSVIPNSPNTLIYIQREYYSCPDGIGGQEILQPQYTINNTFTIAYSTQADHTGYYKHDNLIQIIPYDATRVYKDLEIKSSNTLQIFDYLTKENYSDLIPASQKWSYDMLSYRKENSKGDKVIFFPQSEEELYAYTNGNMSYKEGSWLSTAGSEYTAWVDVNIQFNRHDTSYEYIHNIYTDAVPFFRYLKSNGVWSTKVIAQTFGHFRYWNYENGTGTLRIPLVLDPNNLYSPRTKFEISWYDNEDDLNFIVADQWEFIAMKGFVDFNEDGIDDRTQETDPDSGLIIGDDGGVPDGYIDSDTTPGTPSDKAGSPHWADMLSSVKIFFSNLYGIIPSEIYTILVYGISIMITVGLIKVVF